MPVLFLTPQTLDAFITRLEAIPADAQPRWGSMSHAKMLKHLRTVNDMSLGRIEPIDQSNFFSRTVMRFLVFHVFTTWPKGKVKVPDRLTPEPDGNVEEERRRLVEAWREFVEIAEREPNRRGIHPLVGPQPLVYWRRMHGMHIDHHLRQFGV